MIHCYEQRYCQICDHQIYTRRQLSLKNDLFIYIYKKKYRKINIAHTCIVPKKLFKIIIKIEIKAKLIDKLTINRLIAYSENLNFNKMRI